MAEGGLRETDGHEMRVRVEAVTKRSLEITVMDVDPETDTELVKRAMEKYGEVKRCERVYMSGIWSKVIVNKVKVELVRNKEELPNIIQASGASSWADDTWKLQYQGCARLLWLWWTVPGRTVPDRERWGI